MIVGWLLDTNVVAEMLHPGGSTKVKGWAAQQPEATLYVSILTIGEYEQGIAKLRHSDPRRAMFIASRDRLIGRFAGRIIPVSNEIVRRWGMVSGAVKREVGHSPPVIDTLLAATAMDRDLHLVTRNVRDVRYSGASIFNPWQGNSTELPVAPGTA